MYGTLNTNEVISALRNMIISIMTFSDNVSETKSTLSDLARVDGSMYGDQKVYIATDILKSYDWKGDAEAANLLKLHRPPQPDPQTITLDVFRFIPLTIDRYLSKRAFGTEGAFSQFNGTIVAWLRLTKRVYDSTLYNSFIGTHQASLDTSQNVTIALSAEPDNPTNVELEAYNRSIAMAVAAKMADILVELTDVSRDYNDFENVRSFDVSDLRFVWNSLWVNKIRKVHLPTIFNNKDLIDKFAEHTLPARYFGNVNANAGTTSSTNITVRSLIEKDYNTVEINSPQYNKRLHVFPGDLLPPNTAYEANETYGEDPTVIFKIYHKDSVPLMSSFEASTEFWNPRSLTDTMYLIWGHNTLDHLKNYPFITGKAVVSE